MAAIGAAVGGYIGAKVADKQGKTGWDKVGYVATGAILGGTAGAVAGYAAAPAVASATGIAGISVSAAGVSTIAAAGTTFGKMGTLLAENPNISVNWSIYADHAMQRLGERGISQQMVDAWVATGKVLRQGADKFVYITQGGVAVVSKTGKLITAYSNIYFDEAMKEIVKALFGG